MQDYKGLNLLFLITDIGFILYWSITLLHVIPKEYLFKDYENPILQAWNWSFLPLDLFISFTGFYSLLLSKQENPHWKQFAILSLTLTFTSGLQAISFWAIGNDYNISWWIPNLYLFIYPIYYIPKLIRS
ncbi:DUF5360 family protein [Leptospira andrefontaineae]|uniref:YvaD family protein n=1 Tax=Leptospira andrefontaineae TaxID=2484976 RepID=A0A4R9HAW2_9LEPT|nr:DUF5360 family protein [Leptospira andrefontaineae]TGK43680.1 hypothetical protein EHO65_03305 [Leptospira andrefontaineae]